MRSQVLILEAMVVFVLVVIVLLLAVPVHQDISKVVELVRREDVKQVERILSGQ